MAERDVVICALVRTAIGTLAGTLKDMPAAELAAVAIAAMRETGLKEDAVNPKEAAPC